MSRDNWGHQPRGNMPDVEALLRAMAQEVEPDEAFRASVLAALDSAAPGRPRPTRLMSALAAVLAAGILVATIPGATRAAGEWWRQVAVSITRVIGALPGGLHHLPAGDTHVHIAIQGENTPATSPQPRTVTPSQASALAGFSLVTLHSANLRLQMSQVVPMGPGGAIRVALIYSGPGGREVTMTENRLSGAPAPTPPGAESVEIQGANGWLLSGASGGTVYWIRHGLEFHLGGPFPGTQLLGWATTAGG
jgi:hypothetical protein